ncbi:MAG TPA: NAD(P)-dependent alcohol dehydrogenase [Burkholderiales bacterium]|nr:NAD(P)-dependent alcohol dehydrogenase [Burkholderiales bacterium]
MKAMQYRGYGGPDQIVAAEVPVPQPGPSQLLVRVAASSVNPVDWKLHNGHYRWLMPVRFPSIPGFDVAGEVVETGAQVARFKAGDHVFAMSDARAGGASAEYAVVGEGAAARMPSNLSAPEAAAVPLAGLTALQALRDLGHVAAGKRLLVIGASGGVGHFAVQIAKYCGAEVTAVCSSRHVEMVRGLGASRVIDYTSESDFRGPQPYDIVFDVVVNRPVSGFLRLLAPDGIYVSSLPSFGRVAAAFYLPLCSKRRVRVARVAARGEDLDQLRALCDAGKLRPVIDRVLRLEELAAAHAYSARGTTTGKIAIVIGAAS